MGRPRRVAVPLRVPAPRRGLGPLLRPDGDGPAPDPRPARTPGSRSSTTGPRASRPTTSSSSGRHRRSGGSSSGAGFNSVGIASGGGAGRALAEWIVEGEPTSDLVAVDIRRFAPFNANNQWLHDRVGEVLGLHYDVPWPNRELATARPFRRSPLHHLLAEQGAVFGSKMGWERPNVFAPAGAAAELDYTWGRPDWLAWSDAEQTATRQRVAVFDETSFGKLLVVGRDAEAVLAAAVHGRRGRRPGRAVYTGMLNERGGYEADVTVTRLAADRYLLVTSSASAVRDPAWIERHLRAGEHVSVVDVSSAYAVLGVMGPASRAAARATRVGRPLRRGLPLRDQPGDRPRLRHRAGHPDHLRGRAGLGALRADRVRRGRLRGPAGGRGRPRRRRRRLLRHQLASAWTRGTGPSAPTSPRTTPRSRPGCASPASSDADRLRGPSRRSRRRSRPDRAGGWCRSVSGTPTPCCGAASSCCATGSRPGR